MNEQYFSERNLAFLLYEVFDTEALSENFLFSEHDRISFDLAVGIAIKMASDIMLPVSGSMDKETPVFADGMVNVHPAVRRYMQACGSGGWLEAFSGNRESENVLPSSISTVCRYIYSSANPAMEMFSFLNSFLINLLRKHGDEDIFSSYLQMLSDGVQGTIAFSESSAGSSFNEICTVARLADNGLYKIRGQKIFVLGADFSEINNSFFLVLADSSDENKSVPKLSLFLVPSRRSTEVNTETNDVECSGFFNTLGQRGIPLVGISMGDNESCYGILVGEEGKALEYLAESLNEIRVHEAVSAAGICSKAFYDSFSYTLESREGMGSNVRSDLSSDFLKNKGVQKLLLFQKSVFEGILCLAIQISQYADRQLSEYSDSVDKYHYLIDLLSPLVKMYAVEYGPRSVFAGIECLGGSGYCTDFSIEQCLRDIAAFTVFSETPDLLVKNFIEINFVKNSFLGFDLLFAEIESDINKKVHDQLLICRKRLVYLKNELENLLVYIKEYTTDSCIDSFDSNFGYFVEFLSVFVIGWQWYRQACVAAESLNKRPNGRYADFYRGKLKTCIFFFTHELHKIEKIPEIIRMELNEPAMSAREFSL